MNYYLGMVCGVVCALVFMFIVFRLIRKATHGAKGQCQYDERQNEARGKAYKYAFFTMLIMNAVTMCIFSSETGIDHASFASLMIILAGLLVYVSMAIWKNAYIAVNDTFMYRFLLTLVIGVINVACGFIDLRANGMSDSYINFSLGIAMIVISLELIAKHLYDKSHEADNEE